MDYTIFLPVIIAFALSAVMGPLIIPVLRRLKMDQTEREDGVKSHLKKQELRLWESASCLVLRSHPYFILKTIRRLSQSCF